MKKNVLLWGETVLATGLSYPEACEALKLANEHPLSRIFEFSIHSHPDKKGWLLYSAHRELMRSFIADPSKFVLEIETKP